MENITYNGFFTLQWHITHRCNLRCSHCYQDDYSAFSSRKSLEAVLNQYSRLLEEYGFKGYLNITGGEPLAHPDLFWLLEEAGNRGITTAVLTNGTLIGRREAAELKRLDVDYVQVSLDGLRETHDKIRGEGSFDLAIRGIRELKAQGIYVTVAFTAQRENYKELSRLADFCNNLGADKLWFDRVVIPKDEDKNNLSLSSKEYSALCRKASRLNRQGKISCARALQFIPCKEKNIYSCNAGSRLLAILADGTVMPCRRLPIEAGNVTQSELLTIYRESLELIKLRKSEIPEKCKPCKYAQSCRGGAKCIACAKSGRYDIPDPDCPLI